MAVHDGVRNKNLTGCNQLQASVVRVKCVSQPGLTVHPPRTQ